MRRPPDVIRDNKRAEASIGTMIILIAAVLLATIASSVLVDVAQRIAQQAETSGVQAGDKVSTGLQVIAIAGDRKEDSYESRATSSTIEVLEIKVELLAGSGAVNINETIIQITDGDTSADLQHGGSGLNSSQATATTFVAYEIRDPDAQFPNNIGPGALIKINISVDDSATNLNLDNSTEVIIRIIPRRGITTVIKFITPSAYTTRYIELV